MELNQKYDSSNWMLRITKLHKSKSRMNAKEKSNESDANKTFEYFDYKPYKFHPLINNEDCTVKSNPNIIGDAKASQQIKSEITILFEEYQALRQKIIKLQRTLDLIVDSIVKADIKAMKQVRDKITLEA